MYAAALRARAHPGAALTYDAIDLLAHVVQVERSTEPARIRAGLRGVGRFEGVTGTMASTASRIP